MTLSAQQSAEKFNSTHKSGSVGDFAKKSARIKSVELNLLLTKGLRDSESKANKLSIQQRLIKEKNAQMPRQNWVSPFTHLKACS